MTTITIFPDNRSAGPGFRAVAGEKESVGATAGQALDALTAQLGEAGTGPLLLILPMQPDAYFTAEQQQRLAALVARWRAARDGGEPLPPAEQAELESLVEAEFQAAIKRSEVLAQQANL